MLDSLLHYYDYDHHYYYYYCYYYYYYYYCYYPVALRAISATVPAAFCGWWIQWWRRIPHWWIQWLTLSSFPRLQADRKGTKN